MKRASGLFIGSLVLLFLSLPSFSASITVEGNCTLIGAINNANSDGDTTSGQCVAGSGADEILLTRDVVLTTIDNTTEGDNGLPTIISTITIQGNYHEIRRDESAPAFRIFDIAASGNLTLVNTTLSFGSTLDPDYGGGGILNRGGTLTLSHSTVADSFGYRFGGGVSNWSGTVFMAGSTLFQNRLSINAPTDDAVPQGAGLANVNGTVIVVNSTINENIALGSTDCFNSNPGDICLAGGKGGGIYNELGVVAIHNTTVADNSVFSSAGGEGVVGVAQGGGIHNLGSLDLVNSTISGNMAANAGGGVFSTGVLVITNTTLSGNSSPSGAAISADATAAGTIIANSTGSANCSGVITDDGGNKADDPSCGSIPGDLAGLDSVLADNGGPTLTHALLEGSNAIDAAGDCGLEIDQRGSRRFDGACDAGAVEYGLVQLTIGGTVSGLSGTGLVLQNNASDDLAIVGDGVFFFATPLTNGSDYSVTVLSQPVNPEQICLVTDGSGTLTGKDITSVRVACDVKVDVAFTDSFEQLNDGDLDGIHDSADACPLGDTGWSSSPETDYDGDGCRDATEDSDDDNDMRQDSDDLCVMGDTYWDSTNPALDYDGDGCRDASEDDDDDNDGVSDLIEQLIQTNPLDHLQCGDYDNDQCDDCSQSGDLADDGSDADASNDGPDYDSDGVCDVSDTCNDADSDGWGQAGLEQSTCPFLGDDCDDAPGNTSDDDRDNFCNEVDNCWAVWNPDQLDTDKDCPEPPFFTDPMCGDICDASECEPDGVPCEGTLDCCNGNCNSNNFCGTEGCLGNGDFCQLDSNCCSGNCEMFLCVP
jgi:hypothetical protein